MGKIDVKNMDLYYSSFHALKNINLEIPEKKITAFIGPSGCGKSTLLKSLNRMNDLVEGCKITGDICLDGEDIYGDIDVNLLRKRVGMVFQKPNPFPMSIYDNIAYGPRTHGIHSKEKLDDIVERALRNASIWDEVKDRLKKSALGMSGGQQQRLCICLLYTSLISTKPPCNILFCFLVLWSGKQFCSIVIFNNLTQQEKCSLVRNTSCLLHVVSYDHDGVTVF